MDSRTANNRAANKRVDSLIGYVTGVVSACLILMWSVFNTWLNVLQFRAATGGQADVAGQLAQEGPAWLVTALMVIMTCVIPFLFGLFLLFKTINSTAAKNR